MKQTIEKLRELPKHLDQVYHQYHVNNYRHIDSKAFSMKTWCISLTVQKGIWNPLHYVAEYRTVYDDLDSGSYTVGAYDKHKCYRSL